MIIKKLIVILILILLSVSVVSADEQLPDNAILKKKIERIAILPFYNYSDSDMKYVSTYIPELLKQSITQNSKVEVLNYRDLQRELGKIEGTVKQEISLPEGESLYNQIEAQKFLTSINADVGIIGRFIVHEKVIKIDYKLIFPITGKIVSGPTYEGNVGDRFLTVLENFSESRGAAISEDLFGDTVFGMQKIISRFKGTKYGMFRWIIPVIILLLFYIASKILVWFFEKVLKKLTAKTETDLDDKVIEKAKKPTKWIVILVGIKIALVSLAIRSEWMRYSDSIIIAIIIMLVTYIIADVLSVFIHIWGKKLSPRLNSRIDKDLVPLFVKVVNFTVITIGILMVLSRFEVDIAPLIASLGIAGFAIGFAVKDSLANIIGGIVLILDKSFAVGDKVVVDDDLGVIHEVGLRNTKLMTFDNEVIVIPNGELMNKKFKNYVLPDPKIRVVVKFGVAYGSDIDKVEKVVMDAILKLPDICEDPSPAVVFNEMADFSLNMQAKYWVPDYVNQYGKYIEGVKAVYNALVEAGIDIPFPTHTVYIEKNE